MVSPKVSASWITRSGSRGKNVLPAEIAVRVWILPSQGIGKVYLAKPLPEVLCMNGSGKPNLLR